MRAHNSQAYRKMDVTRERISRTWELRERLLSFQTGFNLVNAAVAYAILESMSGLEPSSVITDNNFVTTVHQFVDTSVWLRQERTQTAVSESYGDRTKHTVTKGAGRLYRRTGSCV